MITLEGFGGGTRNPFTVIVGVRLRGEGDGLGLITAIG